MNEFFAAFLPGVQPSVKVPLERYLPPVPPGMFSAWLAQNIPPGGWLLDPFGSTPFPALEAAKAGYRVVVVCNNPILQFMLEILSLAPQTSDFQAALADLAKERRHDERLETHMRSLYLTHCISCGNPTPVQAFLWRKGENHPYSRMYKCHYCDAEGEYPITQGDIDRLNNLGGDALHRARAMQRATINERSESIVQEVLQTYLQRPLYFLFTLINRFESLPTSELNRKLLFALLLHALDEGNALWPWPTARSRPRQITTPPQFREKNLWNALEGAIELWSTQNRKIELTHWPELPLETGGICLYKGRLKSFHADSKNSMKFDSAITVFPRPNQAFWTLSAIWSGWFWGKEMVLPLKSALKRRRYDWNWHTSALHHTLSILVKMLHPNKQLFGILPELETGFLSAVIVSSESAGFHLRGIALRSEQSIAQGEWLPDPQGSKSTSRSMETICHNSIQQYLNLRNEPATRIQIYANCLSTIAANGIIPNRSGQLPYHTLKEFQKGIAPIFTDTSIIRSYKDDSTNLILDAWWLSEPTPHSNLTLTDRIEIELIRLLQKNPGISIHELDTELCALFPGLLTPSIEFIRTCLKSYAETGFEKPDRWYIKAREEISEREANVLTAKENLEKICAELGYLIEGDNHFSWVTSSGEIVHKFYIIASSVISHFVLFPSRIPPEKCIIVLPGSRAQLLSLKLQRDPRLAGATANGWRFLKFRHLQRMAERNDLTIDLWENLLDKDPPSFEEPTQMQIL